MPGGQVTCTILMEQKGAKYSEGEKDVVVSCFDTGGHLHQSIVHDVYRYAALERKGYH